MFIGNGIFCADNTSDLLWYEFWVALMLREQLIQTARALHSFLDEYVSNNDYEGIYR